MGTVESFSRQVIERVPGYRRFLASHGVSGSASFKELPLLTKQNYLLDLRLILMTVKIMFIKDSTEGFEEIKPSEKKDSEK